MKKLIIAAISLIALSANAQTSDCEWLAALKKDANEVTEEPLKTYRAEQMATATKRCNRDKTNQKSVSAQRSKPGVRLGMTQQQVINDTQWGKPRKINRSVGRFGTHEQWVYDGGYLYFEDGVLTSWQN